MVDDEKVVVLTSNLNISNTLTPGLSGTLCPNRQARIAEYITANHATRCSLH
jgi:hypothetical protein